MIASSITREAYEAIKSALPVDRDSWPPQSDGRGLIRIWLDRQYVDRLGQMRRAGESYSDVIMRLVETER
jgi:hypothetical protein